MSTGVGINFVLSLSGLDIFFEGGCRRMGGSGERQRQGPGICREPVCPTKCLKDVRVCSWEAVELASMAEPPSFASFSLGALWDSCLRLFDDGAHWPAASLLSHDGSVS